MEGLTPLLSQGVSPQYSFFRCSGSDQTRARTKAVGTSFECYCQTLFMEKRSSRVHCATWLAGGEKALDLFQGHRSAEHARRRLFQVQSDRRMNRGLSPCAMSGYECESSLFANDFVGEFAGRDGTPARHPCLPHGHGPSERTQGESAHLALDLTRLSYTTLAAATVSHCRKNRQNQGFCAC